MFEPGALEHGGVEIPLRRLAAPGPAGAAAEVAVVAAAAGGIGVDGMAGQPPESLRAGHRRQAPTDHVAQHGVALVVGVTGEGVPRGLHVQVLAHPAAGYGCKSALDEIHGIEIRSQGFGLRGLVPARRPAQRQERPEARAPDAEPLRQCPDGPPRFAIDLAGWQDRGDGKFRRARPRSGQRLIGCHVSHAGVVTTRAAAIVVRLPGPIDTDHHLMESRGDCSDVVLVQMHGQIGPQHQFHGTGVELGPF